jgi:hypothetical protein
MSSKYSSGKFAIAECDRCGQRYKLKELRKLVIKQQMKNIKVCNECWEPDQPQLSLGMYPVDDPQAVIEPRPDTSYKSSGLDANGNPSGGSRQIQWGWNPVGMGNDGGLTPDNLIGTGQIGTVTIT